MMILTVEEKAPPPYTQRANSIRSSHSSRNCDARLNRLPPHILLQVIYWTCPDGIVPVERRFMLHWMSSSLRYVCRSLWTATMHILRSSYFHLYMRHVLRPFSSDPFPTSVPAVARSAPRSGASSTASAALEPAAQDMQHSVTTPIASTQRETAILDLFILIRSRQDMRSDESDLYLDNEDERYRDMFNFMQPRARLEDLVCKYGLRYDLIALPTPSSSPRSSPYPSPLPSYTTLPTPTFVPSPAFRKTPFSDISITWGNRALSLCTKDSQGRRRVLVEVSRDRAETLESIARRLVGEWWRMEKDAASRSTFTSRTRPPRR